MLRITFATGRLPAGWQAAPGTRCYRRGAAQTGTATEMAIPQAQPSSRSVSPAR